MMGFFSWLTADTQKSIASTHSVKTAKTTYLLQPNGNTSIQEDNYEGYGIFGGVDALSWLAENNLPESVIDSFEGDSRELGIYLDSDYLIDALGNIFAYSNATVHLVHFFEENTVTQFQDYGTKITVKKSNEEISDTVNNHVENGTLTKVSLTKYIKHPLKFSRDALARYEDLPASQECPQQGFFY